MLFVRSPPFAILLIAALSVALATASSVHALRVTDDATRKQVSPDSPFEKFCKPRLSPVDWRFVAFYEQYLRIHNTHGYQLVELLLHAVEGGGVRVDDPRVSEAIVALRRNGQLTVRRAKLQERSPAAFRCVDEFERRAAGQWVEPSATEAGEDEELDDV